MEQEDGRIVRVKTVVGWDDEVVKGEGKDEDEEDEEKERIGRRMRGWGGGKV